ncbi:complex I NDUFA9 subunit family protein [Nitrogeniibacter mangrovi]|uniref:Complex I NDUFA9 subunit family protein n=1 Tax=Nitrogeniibacter mangrovi TaxID=2016596 RepID=A0A6C1AZD6_9RHOO|nr:complex I NDUFA9 subunit family protein [Nitrogeniibacter mangrovi]QID16493.1 complex I NDUFA9 subunit family protein [Nitrogeniibacter mangrovi]
MSRTGRVLLIGGSGFVGSAVAARLVAGGWTVRVPTRRFNRARHLSVLPTTEIVEADVFNPQTLDRLLVGVDAVVNLVGVLHSAPGVPYGPAFERAHVALPKAIAEACRRVGVQRVVHVSALGADVNGPSEYQRSKAAGEAAIRNARPELQWTLLRPSVIFGAGDRFLNLFARLSRLAPILPLAGADARFQPVWVEDVAEVVYACLARDASIRQSYPVAGPQVYTLAELVRFAAAQVERAPWIVPLPDGLARVQARLMECLPEPLMSRDNLRSMHVDNVAEGAPLPFGLTPHPMEAVVPGYLGGTPTRRRLLEARRRHPKGH